MKKILISLLLVLVFVGVAFTTGQKGAAAAQEKLAPFITVYEGSGSVEIGGKVAKFIQDKLGVESDSPPSHTESSTPGSRRKLRILPGTWA